MELVRGSRKLEKKTKPRRLAFGKSSPCADRHCPVFRTACWINTHAPLLRIIPACFDKRCAADFAAPKTSPPAPIAATFPSKDSHVSLPSRTAHMHTWLRHSNILNASTFSATAVSAASVSTSRRAGPFGKSAARPRCAAKEVLLPLQLPMDATRSASFAVDAARAVRAASRLGIVVRSFLDGHGSP